MNVVRDAYFGDQVELGRDEIAWTARRARSTLSLVGPLSTPICGKGSTERPASSPSTPITSRCSASASRSEQPGLHTVSAERIDAGWMGRVAASRGASAQSRRRSRPLCPEPQVSKNNFDGFRPHRPLFGGFPDGDRIGGLAMDRVVADPQLRLLHAQRHKD